MNYRVMLMLVIIAISLSISMVHAQDTISVVDKGFTEPRPIEGALDALFWRTLIIALVAGALGGMVYELIILQGNIELPHCAKEGETSEKYPHAIVKHMYDLGIIARIFVGALAGVIILLVFSPSTILGLVAISVVAGSAGMAVFSSIQDRLFAALAQKDAADTRSKAQQGKGKLSEAITHLEGFKKDTSTRAADLGVTEYLETVTKVEKLLNEAKGALDTIDTEQSK